MDGEELALPGGVRIRVVAIDDLKPSKDNPREISSPNFKRLRASLGHFSQVEPLVYNEKTNRLVGGHSRLAALKALGVERVAISVVDVSADEELALRLTLGNRAVQGRWIPKKANEQAAAVQETLPELAAELGMSDIERQHEGEDDEATGTDEKKINARKAKKLDIRFVAKDRKLIEEKLDTIALANQWVGEDARARAMVAVFKALDVKAFVPKIAYSPTPNGKKPKLVEA